ncbi:hypothetical protein [Agriterribacter sp.]|uniref:hypothetical protein n=1 Tax=Agriterribacter sp. TaxID=2821509 RepID=UPI002B8B5F11|nr:hypothetical protein [Agriterribacter sp.]HRO48147.1 hypothetical protein [Agriterribacter sp.]HRQ16241.1 hypothetical protein [Agriterribacter sp.]
MGTNIIQSGEGVKRFIQRSASYPGISLEEALGFTTEVAKSFPSSQVINRNDIAAVLKKAAASIVREISASVQFQLFSKDKDGYKISPLFKKITNYLDQSERRKLIIEAFGSPKLYAELIEKFNNHAIPQELKTHLIRFHKIAEKAAPDAANVFIESAKFAGVLSDSGILTISPDMAQHLPHNDNVIDNGLSATEIFIENQVTSPVIRQQLQLTEMVNEEKVKIRLTGGKFAYLIYPLDLTKRDISVIQKQIEQLDLIIE